MGPSIFCRKIESSIYRALIWPISPPRQRLFQKFQSGLAETALKHRHIVFVGITHPAASRIVVIMPSPLTVPPFRADHVGSLLRPRALTQGFRQLAAREITPAEYRALQDAAIREVVALQRAAGLRVATDGEFRRGSYWGHFVDAVDGLSTEAALFDFHDDSGHVQPFIAPHVSGKLRRARPISTGEFAFLKDATRGTGLTPKVTMPSPPTMHFW